MAVPVASLDEVVKWASNPGLAPVFSPITGQSCLLFEAEVANLPTAGQQQVADWLRQLPCPTIGIAAPTHQDFITQSCDLRVADAAQATALASNIERNPIAASVLVQTLRTTETLPIMDALHVESLAYATLQGGAEFMRWLQDNRADSPAVPSDDGPAVLMSREDDHVLMELNRASNRNALNIEMRDALVEALQLVIADDSIQTVTIQGRGKCFSVGGDLTEFGTLPDPASAHAIRGVTMPGRFVAQCAARTHFYVHGACIGSGVELPAFGHSVTATAGSFFHLPELQFGLIPGGGGCVSIPRRIGRQRTAWWVLSGKRINAQKALAWGLIDEILEPSSSNQTK